MDKFKNAYEAGRDCALNGANTANCNFRWFGAKELLAEWERGKASVEEELNND